MAGLDHQDSALVEHYFVTVVKTAEQECRGDRDFGLILGCRNPSCLTTVASLGCLRGRVCCATSRAHIVGESGSDYRQGMWAMVEQ